MSRGDTRFPNRNSSVVNLSHGGRRWQKRTPIEGRDRGQSEGTPASVVKGERGGGKEKRGKCGHKKSRSLASMSRRKESGGGGPRARKGKAARSCATRSYSKRGLL